MSAAAEVFGKGASGGSKDETKSSTSEGKLDSCRAAGNDDKASPVTSACYGVGLLADAGSGGVVENKPKAVEYYAKAQFVKDASLRLARIYESGAKGVPADPAKAAKYYGSACLRAAETDPGVCKKAADLNDKAKTSPFMVATYWRKACGMAPWDKTSCDKAKAPATATLPPAPTTLPNGKPAPTGGSADRADGGAPPPPKKPGKK